ncbi:hypothetical protein MSP7336_04364 [Mycobacterium shimoidei]|uniref:DUF2637 domain-containing protein n=2 Tax=Mycobacterium TaxID=1763 RepID=A0A375Z4M7_MYCSH|nr:DUF2637 domain-containing protein [Mycobacterium shimoidei]SRX96089.1 hypothetical protein MSP7336_04364 [Mycobacterium shimoidei]
MTTTETARPMHEVRSILWALLIAATVASVAANIAHAVIRYDFGVAAIGPVLFAMLAPVALLGLFHLMAAWTRAAGDRRAIFWFFLLAIVMLAGAAFRLSFAAIRDLAVDYGYGRADAALFPLILDGLIAVCTVGLVAATRPRRTTASEQLAVHRTAERPAEQVRDSAPQPPREVAPTAVQADPHPAVHRPAEPAGQPLTSEDVDTAPIAEQAEQRPDPQRDPRPVQPAEQVAPTLADTAEQADPQLPRFEVHRDGLAPAPRPAPAAPLDPEDIAVHRATAEHLVADGRTAATVEQVTRVLEMTAQGASQRMIASEVGISSTAVGRIQAAARELAEASA